MTMKRAEKMLGAAVDAVWVGDDAQHVLLVRKDADNLGLASNVAAMFCYGQDVCGDVVVTTAQELRQIYTLGAAAPHWSRPVPLKLA
jgi:hypothetical protein